MQKNFDRNYVLLFMDKVFFINGMAFLSLNTVFTYFLNELGASTFLISFATILVSLMTLLTQPFYSKLAMGLPYKLKTFFRLLMAQRFSFLAFVLLIPWLAHHSDKLLLIAFFIFWGIFNIFVGSYGPFFLSIMPKLISSEERGRLSGFGAATGSLLAIFTSLLIGVILSKVSYPYNYTLLFGIGILFMLINGSFFFFMNKETPDPPSTKEFSYVRYFKDIPKVLRSNRRYSKIVLGSSFFIIAIINLTFYSLFAIKNYDAGPTEIAIFNIILMSVSIFGNVVLGIVADKRGHRFVLVCAALSGMVAGLFILFLPGMLSVYIAFALSSLCNLGYQLSNNMLIIQEVRNDEIPVYVSVHSILVMIVSTSVTLLCSKLIDWTTSFTPMFIITLVASFGAFLVSGGLKRRKV